jgi:magnesium chelatase subunit H
MRFIFLTMDGNHAAAVREAAGLLCRDHNVALELAFYDSTRLRTAEDWARLEADVAAADFVFGAMLFGEDYVRPLERILGAATCPVSVITSNPSLIRLTRLGKLSLAQRDDDGASGLLQQFARRFRPKVGQGQGEGKRQLAMLRNVGKVMKHIPGKARDLHTYIAIHQYWLHCSAENLRRMLCLLIERYVPGYKGKLPIIDPIEYPDVALLHPDAPAPFGSLDEYEKWQKRRKTQYATRNTSSAERPASDKGTVGLLSLRTVALSGNTAHLDALVHALERRGLAVRMAYSAGLDFRPAITKFMTSVDVLLNGAGFSLIGGMAESRPDEAREALDALDVGYLDMIPLSFQRVEEWQRDDSGLSPMQTAMNVAVPELDSAAEPLVFGGPTEGSDTFVALHDQIERAADRIARRVALRRKPNREKKLALVLFNFPPTLGNIGTAAYLDVFASLHRLMQRLSDDGYAVTVPASVEELRTAIVEGNSQRFGTDGNVAARLSVEDYRRLFPHYADIEPFWGDAPGALLNNGKSFYILGAQFGQLFVGIQPSFGYERDPMRLLMAKDAAPHHGFAAFYTWIDRVYGADAVIHFGTHGALEFMPGKQAGLSGKCWPARLLGGLPNFYYYSVNNPSEATIAKRRGAAILISYMVPPLQQAGLYKGLRALKDSLDSYRQRPSPELLQDIQTQAERLQIADYKLQIGEPATCNLQPATDAYIAALAHELILVEQRMIPVGLHVLGHAPSEDELVDVLALVAAFVRPTPSTPPLPQQIAASLGWDYEHIRARLKTDADAQAKWERIDALVKQAMRRFVSSQFSVLSSEFSAPTHNSKLTTQNSADGYLQAEANIKPGALTSLWSYLSDLLSKMTNEQELNGLMRALRGGYIPPSPGNDVVRNPAVVPTGRNIHGLDPFRVPTPAAQDAGERLMRELVEQLTHEHGHMPETVAMVLWGIDNLKSDGEGVAQALALLGARVVVDELGKVSDVALIPQAELKRPRIDVVVTVSGIFRDLLSHQMLLVDKAARLAAEADEPIEFNFVRKHALAQAAEMNTSVREAAARVFANAPGSYGANVNHLVESSTWDSDDQLGEAFLSRKSFAIGPGGQWRDAREIMERALATVDATFQNVDSFEVGISDIDHYYENLGGVTKSVELLRGWRPPVLVADALSTVSDRLSTLEQMVRLEARAKLLNPKWFEGMLAHGYQGVHEIEARVGNTYGWSATANAVEGWVYQGVAETYVLDEAMRERLAQLNPHATAAIARRLLEANARGFWPADDATLDALRELYADLEDRLEGVRVETAMKQAA